MSCAGWSGKTAWPAESPLGLLPPARSPSVEASRSAVSTRRVPVAPPSPPSRRRTSLSPAAAAPPSPRPPPNLPLPGRRPPLPRSRCPNLALSDGGVDGGAAAIFTSRPPCWNRGWRSFSSTAWRSSVANCNWRFVAVLCTNQCPRPSPTPRYVTQDAPLFDV